MENGCCKQPHLNSLSTQCLSLEESLTIVPAFFQYAVCCGNPLDWNDHWQTGLSSIQLVVWVGQTSVHICIRSEASSNELSFPFSLQQSSNTADMLLLSS